VVELTLVVHSLRTYLPRLPKSVRTSPVLFPKRCRLVVTVDLRETSEASCPHWSGIFSEPCSITPASHHCLIPLVGLHLRPLIGPVSVVLPQRTQEWKWNIGGIVMTGDRLLLPFFFITHFTCATKEPMPTDSMNAASETEVSHPSNVC